MSLWKSSPSCVTQRRGLYPNVAGCSSGSPSAGWLFAWPKSQPVNLTYLTSAYEETAKFEINQFVQLWFNCNHIDMPLFSSNLFSVCIVLCLQLILALTAITIFLCSFVQNNNNNKKIPPREERNNESVFTNSQKTPRKPSKMWLIWQWHLARALSFLLSSIAGFVIPNPVSFHLPCYRGKSCHLPPCAAAHWFLDVSTRQPLNASEDSVPLHPVEELRTLPGASLEPKT